MSISRLFRPNNDRSITKNLVTDNEGWAKIAGRQLADDKRTKLIELNAQIDAFAVRWGHKGMGILWNPMFIREFLQLKKAESRQQVGQKVFSVFWIHPMLLSSRIAKFCPAVGYVNSDMEIMAKATSGVEEKISVMNNSLMVVNDSFHSPDNDADDDDDDDDDFELVNNKIDDFVVLAGSQKRSASSAERSFVRQSAIDEENQDPDNINLSAIDAVQSMEHRDCPLESQIEQKVEPKIEPKIEPKSNENPDFNLKTILCGTLCGVSGPDIKTEKDEKPIFGFHAPSSLPSLPAPVISSPVTSGKYFAEIKTNASICPLEVSEVVVDGDDFSEDLDADYLNHLGTTVFASPQNSSINTSSGSLAPKINRQRSGPVIDQPETFGLDFSLPNALFEEDEEEKAEADRTVVRQGRTSWSESTPQGKLLRGGRGKYPGN